MHFSMEQNSESSFYLNRNENVEDAVMTLVGVDEKVAILDAGAQYGKVIDRKVRELKVCSEILPLDTPAFTLKEQNYKFVNIFLTLCF